MAFFGFGTALGDPIEGPVLRVPAAVEEAFGRVGDPIEAPAPRVMPAAVDEAVRRVPNLDRIEGQTLEDRLLSFEAKMREFSALIDGLADGVSGPRRPTLLETRVRQRTYGTARGMNFDLLKE